jgi:predicted alpha/beta-hydrolase family hydrolase
VRDAVTELRKITGGWIAAGGHSYGGRQTTMLAAREQRLCDVLLALSYPLHPPKKPEQWRTAHFAELTSPVLFLHGSRDGFGSPAEMRAAMEAIPSRTRLSVVEGAGHDLKSGKFDIPALVIGELRALLEG